MITNWKAAAGPAAIGAISLGLLVLAAIDFVWAGRDGADWTSTAPTAGVAAPSAEDAVAFHELVPDATDDVGTTVRLEGTVAAVAPGAGYWVRDLRDHAVFVQVDEPDRATLPSRGDAVRILGRVAILPVDGQDRRVDAVRRRLPPGAIVIGDVKIMLLQEDRLPR